MTGSAVAVGMVSHQRQWPVAHGFRYQTGWLLLDTRHLGQTLDRGWWSGFLRPGLMRYHRRDFLAGPEGSYATDLDTAVRERVAQALGERPTGAIQLLTNLRMFGHAFNPVSFYFCRDATGAVRAIVAEITNTPWGERFAYILGPSENLGTAEDHRYDFRKAFHVSPFHPMAQRYVWRFRFAPERVAVHMVNHQDTGAGEQPVFSATLALRLAPATPARLWRHLWAWPGMSLRVLVAIYRQALALWLKQVPTFTNPTTVRPNPSPEPA
jgi:uncharacterized protein